ncbi:hypothetical protein [Catenisphaera adipataccumulans]|uniref:Uncharacterized protein n=1 Tax=Catenisphaera adipataccumulans TaxID=700500 RepID=A0A7W8CXF8_9FIRM|nr:hypothetical protein [Catenisphaera adipataccumulans]MBB5183402.1 hypothetical protein [Catenisphaera adipataccumulans]
MTIIHLEPQEFTEKLFVYRAIVYARPFVLENHIAGMVYLFDGSDGDVYYLDRIYNAYRQEEIDRMDPQRRHADLYRKVALDACLTH